MHIMAYSGPGAGTVRGVRSDIRGARDNVLRLLRHGSRVVFEAPLEGVNFGNFLYFWLHAHQARRRNVTELVMAPPVLFEWVNDYPRLRRLTIAPREVRLTDRRVFEWNSRFGLDFSRDDLTGFIAEYLLDSPRGFWVDRSWGVTVNIRRGNYYSVPHLRGTYSFDIPAYLEAALERLASSGPAGDILVISDDPDWCELKLDTMLKGAGASVTYLRGVPPASQFDVLSRSRRIIGTNSTFSYWGAYVSTVRYGRSGHVIMPRFHARLGDEPWAYQLDPEWDVVDDLPGGWDA